MAAATTEKGSDGLRGRDRFIELSRPKQSKAIWITTFGPRVMWGTQDLLWRVSDSAKRTRPTPRLCELARPKNQFQEGTIVPRDQFNYSCGRSSMIWSVGSGAKIAEPTERIATLATPKRAPEKFQNDRPLYVFSCGRSSPIWGITDSSPRVDKRAATERLIALSKWKSTHPEFVGNKEVETIIPPPALKCYPSERLTSLSSPKPRREEMFREPQWPVSAKAKSASASTRCMELAKPKALADGYTPSRDVVWQVSRGARSAHVSSRMEELSKPIVRASMDHVQFDPDAFLVKESARKGKCSKRVEELAQPIER